MIFFEVLPLCDPKDSTFLTTSMPSTTCSMHNSIWCFEKVWYEWKTVWWMCLSLKMQALAILGWNRLTHCFTKYRLYDICFATRHVWYGSDTIVRMGKISKSLSDFQKLVRFPKAYQISKGLSDFQNLIRFLRSWILWEKNNWRLMRDFKYISEGSCHNITNISLVTGRKDSSQSA